MKHFAGKEIITFLKAIDQHLKTPARIEMIGGAAALVSFEGSRDTLDIDITGPVRKISDACDAPRASTGLNIPVQTAIWEAPYEYESRLKRLNRPRLKKLQVFVPEKHDWALMKVTRYMAKDAQDIQEVASRIGFDKRILVERFVSEMTHVSGNPRELVLSFLLMVERLFGKVEADRLEARLKDDRRWNWHRPT